MTKSTITRERLEEIVSEPMINQGSEFAMMARMALAAMDSSESVELPLDYLQGHKDGLEWAAQLAEANHPETGDWLYDDPIELAKAIRKGPDMPPAQPVADSEPVAYMTYKGYLLHAGDPKLAEYSEPMPLYADPRPEPISAEPVAWLLSGGGAKNVVVFDGGNAYADPLREVTPLYRHAQPVPEEIPVETATIIAYGLPTTNIGAIFKAGHDACRAARLQAQSDDDGEPTDDERIMAIEGIHNCERCGDEGWVVGEMGITRCACGQAGNSQVIPDSSASMLRRWLAFGRGMQNAGSQLPINLISETESMLAAAPQPQNAPQNIPEIIANELIAAVNRLLDSNGSRGCYSAIKCYDAHIEVERLLAAARQEVKP